MKSKTINGVPRELLERFYTHAYVRPALLYGDDLKLRALLDAPVNVCEDLQVLREMKADADSLGETMDEESSAELAALEAAQRQGEPVGFRYRANNEPWVWMDESPFADGRHHYKQGYEELEPLYAAQPAPQGEPVARQPDAIIEGVMTSVGITHVIYASTVSLKHGEQVKLYAEQPAPVAPEVGEPYAYEYEFATVLYSSGPGKFKKVLTLEAPDQHEIDAGCVINVKPLYIHERRKYDDTLLPFLALMRKELHANSHKGDREGWLGMDPLQATSEIYHHAEKLAKAVAARDYPQITEYTADVGNCAMMLLDVCGGLGRA